MNSKIVKFLMLALLFCSTILATTMISTCTHENNTNHISNQVDAGHLTLRLIGDGVGGGHPLGNQTGNQTS